MADLSKIDDDMLTAFLDKGWNTVSCEVCHTNVWSLGRSGAARWAGVPIVSEEFGLSTNFWAVLPFICVNCGNTKLLTVGVIEAWASTEEGKRAIAKVKEQKRG